MSAICHIFDISTHLQSSSSLLSLSSSLALLDELRLAHLYHLPRLYGIEVGRCQIFKRDNMTSLRYVQNIDILLIKSVLFEIENAAVKQDNVSSYCCYIYQIYVNMFCIAYS